MKDECHDIDECAQPTYNKCDHSKSFCINTIGSYTCDCKDGHKKIGDFCYDIDEVSFQKKFLTRSPFSMEGRWCSVTGHPYLPF